MSYNVTIWYTSGKVVTHHPETAQEYADLVGKTERDARRRKTRILFWDAWADSKHFTVQ